MNDKLIPPIDRNGSISFTGNNQEFLTYFKNIGAIGIKSNVNGILHLIVFLSLVGPLVHKRLEFD